MYQNCIPFYGLLIFHWLGVPPIVYLHSTFELFPTFVVNNAAVNIGVEILVQFLAFNAFRNILRSEVKGSHDRSIFKYLRTTLKIGIFKCRKHRCLKKPFVADGATSVYCMEKTILGRSCDAAHMVVLHMIYYDI